MCSHQIKDKFNLGPLLEKNVRIHRIEDLLDLATLQDIIEFIILQNAKRIHEVKDLLDFRSLTLERLLCFIDTKDLQLRHIKRS